MPIDPDKIKSAFDRGLISEEMFQRALSEPMPVASPVVAPVVLPEPAPLPAPTLMPSEPSSITQGTEPVTPVIESAPAPAAERYRQSIDDMADIQAKAAEEQAVLKEQAIAEEQRLVSQEQEELAKQQEEIQASEARIESNMNSLRNMKPETFWGSKSDSDRMMSGIALALGALGSAFTGGPNTAMQIINGQMQDFRAKEDAKFNKTKELINLSRLSLADKQKALTAAKETWASRRLGAAKVTEKQLDLVASKAKSPQILEKAEQIKAELDMKQEATRQEVIAEFKKEQRTEGTGLRKEFNALPQVKEHTALETTYGKINAAEPTPAGDIALITSYMKMLDPGSVVREGEFLTAEQAAGIPTRIVNMYNKAISGTRLTEDQRKDFKSQSKQLLDASKKKLEPTIKQYTKYATDRGLPVEDVIGYDQPEEVVPVQTKTINGKTYQKVPGGWQETE